LVELARDVSVDHAATLVRYPKGLQLFKSLLPQKPKPVPFCIWISGATGIGKTRACVTFAEKLVGSENLWISNGLLKWFDGYCGQEIAILDDFRTQETKFNQMLRLLDRYPYRVEIKGGFHNWIPKIIFITAPRGPREMWSLRRDEDLRQLERRIHHNLEFPDTSNWKAIFKEICHWFALRYPNEEPPELSDEEQDDFSLDSLPPNEDEESEDSLLSIQEAVMRANADSDLDTLSYDDETNQNVEEKVEEEVTHCTGNTSEDDEERPPLMRTKRVIDLTCYEQLDKPDLWYKSEDDEQDNFRSKRFF
jgi:hypothetical protein